MPQHKLIAIKPALKIRNGFDVLVLIFCLPWALTYSFFPGLLLAMLPLWPPTLVTLFASLLVTLLWNVLILITMVRDLSLSPEGVRFRRLLWRPKVIPWSELHTITPASQTEVVLHGILRPAFPPREHTRTHTTSGHYRFESSRGIDFFRPSDEETFLRGVHRYRPDLIRTIPPPAPPADAAGPAAPAGSAAPELTWERPAPAGAQPVDFLLSAVVVLGASTLIVQVLYQVLVR